jgi:hypothetical protein
MLVSTPRMSGQGISALDRQIILCIAMFMEEDSLMHEIENVWGKRTRRVRLAYRT